MPALLRIGTKVRTIDRGARVHGRSPDKPEAIGTIQDHHRPYGRHSKDRTPPYYVTFETGEAAWYDASEVEPLRGGRSSMTKSGSAKRKTPQQLEREIAQSLASSGQPQLADLFADPTATKTFVQEMRREIQKTQTSEKPAATLAARPFTVKHLEDGRRALFGRYPSESEARAAADRINGWIEHEGRVVYGRAPNDHSTRRLHEKKLRHARKFRQTSTTIDALKASEVAASLSRSARSAAEHRDAARAHRKAFKLLGGETEAAWLHDHAGRSHLQASVIPGSWPHRENEELAREYAKQALAAVKKHIGS